LMTREDQEQLLGRLARTVELDTVVLVREADRSAGWGFAAVRWSNRLKAAVSGAWDQPFHFRSAREWSDCFSRHGWTAELKQMGQGTPFANVLFRLTRG